MTRVAATPKSCSRWRGNPVLFAVESALTLPWNSCSFSRGIPVYFGVEYSTQRVVAKNPLDDTQVRLIREHLRSIEEQFRDGDFSAPSLGHGDDMLGLTQLKAAKPGQISIDYKDVNAGGQLTFRTRDTAMVAALHEWFSAQLVDHGSDTMDGHQHQHGDMQMQ
ncbi:hypothetical protein [Paraburkholderia fungorum]|uniref:Aspartate carbamoyltransferase n=1 Tax=Paraburkholderia fungorum TaxID=134537 RepID=A0AAP5QIZ2_9BURK|nr:hypothetical protein [Paraburkholderia fungorum]MDT8843485.1 hypothetical protein [Paraburkholderia fungorum]